MFVKCTEKVFYRFLFFDQFPSILSFLFQLSFAWIISIKKLRRSAAKIEKTVNKTLTSVIEIFNITTENTEIISGNITNVM